MVRSIQRIEQALAAIAEQVETLRAASCKRYQRYLHQLSQSLQRQLLAAAYQVCTQFYPDEFLALGCSERQALQQAIRQIGSQGEERLRELAAEPAFHEPAFQGSLPATLPVQLPNKLPLTAEQWQLIREKLLRQRPAPEDGGQSEVVKGESAGSDSDLAAVPPAELRETITLSSLVAASASEPPAGARGDDFPQEQLLLGNPDRLAQWFQQVEVGIAEVLQAISVETNRTLRAAAILPTRLPPQLLDAAVQSEESSPAGGPAPNLLHLLVEAEREGDEAGKESAVLQVTAICLRLTELEFADAVLAAERQQLRDLASQVAKLSQQYQKLQRERAIASAEAAWRASWHEG